MNRHLRQTYVIARRDFLAIVATPTFLLFLLAPVFMLGFGLVGGLGASGLADTAIDNGEMVAIVAANDRADVVTADRELRELFNGENEPPALKIVTARGDLGAQARRIAGNQEQDVYAVLYGDLKTPVILERNRGGNSGRYLAGLAETVLQSRASGGASLSAPPRYQSLPRSGPSNTLRVSLGFGAVFIIFLLTLMLAGQAVGMLAEEKGNKVIEILAAAVPLEAVFAGKLLAMLGVAILFIGFWMLLGTGGGIAAAVMIGDQAAAAGSAAAPFDLASFAPAIGWPAFLGLGFAYFLMAFMLLGAVFLGIGAQAATMREIQMLSLPITIFQVAMFGLSSAAANAPQSSVATVAQLFPFSSPFAMAARGATDPAYWPHLLALGWQGIWVAIIIWLSVQLFRRGVLKSGPGLGLGRRAEAQDS